MMLLLSAYLGISLAMFLSGLAVKMPQWRKDKTQRIWLKQELFALALVSLLWIIYLFVSFRDEL